MARAIVRIKDNLRKNHTAPHTAARPGDVVDVLEDGVDPGRQIKSPDWLVVDVPGVKAAVLKAKMCEAAATVFRVRKYDLSAIADATTKATIEYKPDGDAEKADILDHVSHKTTGDTLADEGVKLTDAAAVR